MRGALKALQGGWPDAYLLSFTVPPGPSPPPWVPAAAEMHLFPVAQALCSVTGGFASPWMSPNSVMGIWG